MATEDDKIDTGALATVVAVGAAGMIGISLAVNALVRHEVGTLSVSRDEVGADAYRALKKEQTGKLTGPVAWADQKKGEVAIPIERAMSLVLADLKRNPWAATPAPPADAGAEAADAAPEAADAGADAATAPEADAGTAEEPPAPAPLSPVAPTPSGSTTPTSKGSAPRTLPPPTVPPAPPPPASAPAQPAPPAPPATKP